MSSKAIQPVDAHLDLAGSLPYFPNYTGDTLATSLPLPSFRQKRLLFAQLASHGQVHVFSAECRAGERLRVQMLLPALANGGGLIPAFAVVAQSLPYSADVRRLPFELPAGFSAVVAAPPGELSKAARDLLTGAGFYPGPIVDTHTLVGGRCYIVVWSPANQMGKYALQLGYGWPTRWSYWLQLPLFWWQIRGWFGLSRAAGYVAMAAACVGIVSFARRRRKPRHTKSDETVAG